MEVDDVGLTRLGALLAFALVAGCAAPVGPTPVAPTDDAPRPQEAAIRLERVADGFDAPLLATHLADASGRLLVVEQTGRIHLLDGSGRSLWLDVSALVSTGGERGLLGLAVREGRAYVSYTDAEGDSVLARYGVADGGRRAEPASAEVLLRVDQPYANHNGGHVAFGPDGFLYFGLGDGGSAGDPQGNAQDPHALLGSLLRLDVSGEAGYAIPPDNPFAAGGGAPEVWAKGLRNPWRFSFDRETGDLYVGDVGQHEWEEIDFLPAGTPGGANFGWSAYEGAHRYRIGAEPFSAHTLPVAEYARKDGACAVTGGHVARDPETPRLAGLYLFGDYCSGEILGLRHADGAWRVATLLDTDMRISSFAEAENGALLVVDHAGAVHRIVEGSGALPAGLA